MADELFGAASGFRLGEHDRLAAQEQLGRIALQPAQLRKLSAEAGLDEEKLREHQQMSRLMAQYANEPQGVTSDVGPTQPQSQSTPLMRLADISMKSGLWEQSMKLSSAAYLQQSREASAVASRVAAAKNLEALNTTHLNRLDGLMAEVTDQASLDTANTLYSMMYPGQRSPLAGAQYSPELLKEFSSSLITAKDRAHNAIISDEYDSRERNRRSQEDFRKFRQGILGRQLELAEQREDRLSKAGGGKGPNAPTPQEVKMANDLVLNQVYGGKIPADDDEMNALSLGAKNIASRAKSLIRENPAMDWKTALQRSFTESQADGEWLQQSTFGGLGRDKKLYQGSGKTADTAIRLPSKSSDLKKDKFYINNKGQVAQWTGTGFSPVAAPSGSRSLVGAGAEADDENADDDSED